MTISEHDAIEAKLLEAIAAADAIADGARVVLSNLSAHGKYASTCARLTIGDAAKAYDTLVQAAKLLRAAQDKEES